MKHNTILNVIIWPVIIFLLSLGAYSAPVYFRSIIPLSMDYWLFLAGGFLTSIAIIWLIFRLIDVFIGIIVHRTSHTGRRLDKSLAAFIAGTLKVLAFLITAVIIASNLGFNVTGLVAGLGIGGLAIALAAQESLSNLFGSLVIFTDRPFKVGDWIVIGTTEGIVESVGFRSTRIRTFYNSLITVPNGELMKMQIDNMGVRRYRRTKTIISVTYGTPPSKMEAFTAGIRELIMIHPYTRKDLFHCWFREFGPASLNIELTVHFKVADYAMENRERQRLFLDIMRLADELGVEFAFPTQTIYMGKDVEKPPVFPESGDIKSASDSEIEFALKKAHAITTSELGGENVIPEPFTFERKHEAEQDLL